MLKMGIVLSLLFGSINLFAKGECRKEMKEKCSQYKGDRKAMRSCVEEQLSDECKEKVKRHMKKKRKKKRNSEE